jgi:hypothetical protein
MPVEELEFESLDPYLLLKNGNYLYKVPFRGAHAVLKVYFGSRSLWRYLGGTLSNCFEGQTSFMPRARRRNELENLKLWRDAGFRVFGVYEDVVVKGLPEGGYTLFEYVAGLKFTRYFGDAGVALAERLETYRRFLGEWTRRHELAARLREPRLVHENGDLKHVMIVDGGFLYFDFEMSYRSRRRVEEFIGREILAYLKSLGKIVGPELFGVFLEETLAHYGRTDFLENAYRLMYAHPNPVLRAARAMDRWREGRAAKPFSKHNVARLIRQGLDRRR